MRFDRLRLRAAPEPSVAHAPPPDAVVSVPAVVLGSLVDDEAVQSCVRCRPSGAYDTRLVVLTDKHVRAVDRFDRQAIHRLDALIGLRSRDSIVRLGFRATSGDVTLLTVVLAGDQDARREFHMVLAEAWIRRTGLPYPASDLENCADVPPI